MIYAAAEREEKDIYDIIKDKDDDAIHILLWGDIKERYKKKRYYIYIWERAESIKSIWEARKI